MEPRNFGVVNEGAVSGLIILHLNTLHLETMQLRLRPLLPPLLLHLTHHQLQQNHLHLQLLILPQLTVSPHTLPVCSILVRLPLFTRSWDCHHLYSGVLDHFIWAMLLHSGIPLGNVVTVNRSDWPHQPKYPLSSITNI